MRSARKLFLLTGMFSCLWVPSWAQSDAAFKQLSFDRLEKGLNKRIEKFDADGLSLKEAIGQLREITGINFIIHPRIFEKQGPDGVLLNFSMTDVSARSVLSAILRLNNLVADYQDEALYISPAELEGEEFKGQEFISRTYNVRPLITQRPQFFFSSIPGSLEESTLLRKRRKDEFFGGDQDIEGSLARSRQIGQLNQRQFQAAGQKLVEYIKLTIAPRSWEADGRANVRFNSEGTITVSNTMPVHFQILKLLDSFGK